MNILEKYKQILFIILIAVTIPYCTEPFEIEINDYENLLVIQGSITNEAGPYKVLLSRTFRINTDTTIHESNAIVTISDNLGNIETLTETEPGVYQTRPSFKSKIGNQYQLSVVTSDNTTYESQFVTLTQGIEIGGLDTIYNRKYDFNLNRYINGVDLVLQTSSWNVDEEVYLKWDYEEVWEIRQKWDEVEIPSENQFNVSKNNTSQEICWKYEYSNDIMLDKSSNYSTNRILGKVINYIDENSSKPYYGYSILIKQYTINESAYKYWEMVNENNNENGDLFDNIPYNAISNIECCDENKLVIGYFDAHYLSKKRYFYKAPIKGLNFVDYNRACQSNESTLSAYLRGVLYSNARIIYYNPADQIVLYTYQSYCVDCEAISSTTKVRPDFWIY